MTPRYGDYYTEITSNFNPCYDGLTILMVKQNTQQCVIFNPCYDGLR